MKLIKRVHKSGSIGHERTSTQEREKLKNHSPDISKMVGVEMPELGGKCVVYFRQTKDLEARIEAFKKEYQRNHTQLYR